MDAKKMKQFLYERSGSNILDVKTKEGIDEIMSIFDHYQAQTEECWLELHYNKNTDIIFEVRDFENFNSMFQYLSENTKEYASNAWEVIPRIIKEIEQRVDIIPRFTLEFDNIEITRKTFCPCFFFEIDIEKVRQNDKDIIYIYKIIEEILEEILDIDKGILTNSQILELAQKDIFVWSIGFMMSRTSKYRLCIEPVDKKKMLDVIDVFEIDRKKLENSYLQILGANEYIVDCNYSNGDFSDFGVAVYFRKQEERLKVLQSWVEMGYISKKEYSGIKAFCFKQIVEWEGKKSLVWGQLAHCKFKFADELTVPKVYLRIKEILEDGER